MASRAKPPSYEPLDVPNYPAALLREMPNFWDGVREAEQLAQERLESENAQLALKSKRRQVEDEEERRSFFESNKDRSIDEIVPEIEKMLLSQGEFDSVMKLRDRRADEERQRQSDALRVVSSVGDMLPTEQAVKILNSALGNKYGEIKEIKPKAPKSAFRNYKDAEGNAVVIDTSGKTAADIERELREKGVGKKAQSYEDRLKEEYARRALEAMGVSLTPTPSPSPSPPKTSLSSEDLDKAEKAKNKTTKFIVKKR